MDQIIPNIIAAATKQRESSLSFKTDLKQCKIFSDKYKAQIFFKREDQQQIRVFKMRGVYNKFIQLTKEQRARGVCCSSDGNHAQAVAFFCNYFKVKGTLFLPEVVYSWKFDQCYNNGREWVTIVPKGICIQDAENEARKFANETSSVYIHPYNDQQIIEGNATMAIEILDEIPGDLDYLFIPVGGGGLAAGVSAYVKAMSPHTKIIGVEPDGAPCMTLALQNGKPTKLNHQYSRFCDGSAIAMVGDICFESCKKNLEQVVTVPEGRLATVILNLYNQGIVVEPSGALSVSVLDRYSKEINGKNVCCLITGGTVDLSRFDDFKEMSQLYEGLKYFFLIQFPLKPQILKNFVSFCLGPEDEISHIQFQKKNNRERGPALVAIEVTKKENIKIIMERMTKMHLTYQCINDSKELYDLLI